ncbi:Uncharacterized protein conserved in bacteria [Serratia fonticola]|uniref:Uncharacterized protein conserved in bacteria n=1 Tax=Serratia fonticola TaxID=47917 RepID=A0A4U9TCW3_SERFO|nr:Uncharacterized protein conserved in bacteria [Serratia fonticola]
MIALETSARGQFELEVSFLGLHGSQSPLPGYYLDSLAWEDAQNENRLTDFLNVFNHRLLMLLHQIWRKYRYYICFDEGGNDDVSQRMFALVGLSNEAIRKKTAHPPRQNAGLCRLAGQPWACPGSDLQPGGALFQPGGCDAAKVAVAQGQNRPGAAKSPGRQGEGQRPEIPGGNRCWRQFLAGIAGGGSQRQISVVPQPTDARTVLVIFT